MQENFNIEFIVGDTKVKNQTIENLEPISYNNLDDKFKPYCFNMYIRSAIANIIEQNYPNQNINPFKVSIDVLSMIDVESYRESIMSSSVDVENNPAVRLLSENIFQNLQYYGMYNISYDEIISIFKR